MASKKKFAVRIRFSSAGTGVFWGRTVPVIRGDLMPEFLGQIAVPDYQRMVMEHEKHSELMDALSPEDGIGIPDDLLLCAHNADFRSLGGGEIVVTTSIINLLDGHQRLAATKARLKAHLPVEPVGVKIFLGTTDFEERNVFYQINRKQTKVSSDVLMRNQQDNAAIVALRELEKETEGFPSVRWDQLKQGDERIHAKTLYGVAVILHGYNQQSRLEDLLEALEEIQEREGTDRLKENVKTFFAAVQKAFDTDDLREYMFRADLLRGLALVFRDYQEFWDASGKKLVIRADKRNKLAAMPRRTMERGLEPGSTVQMGRSLRAYIESGKREGSKGLTPRTWWER